MRKAHSKNCISALAALLLLAVFSLSILGVLLGGGRIYKTLTANAGQQYDSRTVAQYLWTKLAQCPGAEYVKIESFEGCQSLAIREDGCVLRVYCHNGYLMELYSRDISGFTPGDGEKILPLDSLTIGQEGNLLTFSISCRGKTRTLYYSMRG